MNKTKLREKKLSETDVLRRMLATPPQPHVPKKRKKKTAKKPAK